VLARGARAEEPGTYPGAPLDPMKEEGVVEQKPPPPFQPEPSIWSTLGSGNGDTREGLDPFPSTGRYLDYGVAFNSESSLSPGRLCPKEAKESCVFGSGGGISVGAAYRTLSNSLGALYEVTFHDSSNIYQRGVLQQFRGEWRVRPRMLSGGSVTGFLGVGGQIQTYGDNWAIATWGPGASGMIGGEIDLGVKVAIVVSLAYRALYFRSFQDASGQERPAGIAHVLGLTLGLELHDPL
jgi:hypothetical protein